MKVRYHLAIVNEDFFNTIIKDEHEASLATALSSRTLFFHICPRVGEFIFYPMLRCNPEHTRWWLHQRIVLEILEVIHNPVSAEYDLDKPEGEFDIVLTVKASLREK